MRIWLRAYRAHTWHLQRRHVEVTHTGQTYCGLDIGPDGRRETLTTPANRCVACEKWAGQ